MLRRCRFKKVGFYHAIERCLVKRKHAYRPPPSCQPHTNMAHPAVVPLVCFTQHVEKETKVLSASNQPRACVSFRPSSAAVCASTEEQGTVWSLRPCHAPKAHEVNRYSMEVVARGRHAWLSACHTRRRGERREETCSRRVSLLVHEINMRAAAAAGVCACE